MSRNWEGSSGIDVIAFDEATLWNIQKEKKRKGELKFLTGL